MSQSGILSLPAGAIGTVTSFAFTDGSGFDGTVTNPTTTPTLSLTTSISSGHVLVAGAAGAITGPTDFEYDAAAGRALRVSNIILELTGVAFADSPYIAFSTDYYLTVNSSGGAVVIRLPDAPAAGKTFVIKDSKGSAAANNITITTVGGVVDIDAAPTYVINTNYGSVQVLFDGTAYEVY